MKENLTEIVFILDKSGSMYPLTNDTIGGFNSMLEKQRAKEGDAILSTVLFNDDSEVIMDRIPIQQAKNLTKEDYYASGCTALLDAIGQSIKHIEKVHDTLDDAAPAKTLFIIITDGYENASCLYNYRQISKMVTKKQKDGWEFLFLGANIDAFKTANDLGIRKERAANYHADAIGTQLNFSVLSNTIEHLRANPQACLENWAEEIEEDYNNR